MTATTEGERVLEPGAEPGSTVLWLPADSRPPVKERADMTRLDERALGAMRSLWQFTTVTPESAAHVYTRGILERTPHVRDFFKKADALLKPGGRLTVDFFLTGDPYRVGQPLRPLGFLMQEYSLSLGERYRYHGLRKRDGWARLEFEKLAPTNPTHDTMQRWTFGIVSNGQKNDRVLALIEQVARMGVPEVEVLVCGPAPAATLPDFVRVLPDGDLGRDSRAPTPAKKNRIVGAACFNNLVLMHDRIEFTPEWYAGMVGFGNYFEVLTTPIRVAGTNDERMLDWLASPGDPTWFRRDRVLLLPYTHWHPQVYIDGGYMIAKRHVLLRTPYDERLHWGEAEDLHLSRRLQLAGVSLGLNPAAPVLTRSDRHRGVRNVWPRYVLARFGAAAHRLPRYALAATRLSSRFRRFLRAPLEL